VSVEPEPGLLAALDAWRTMSARQQPAWPDAAAVVAATAELATMPPLVFAGEADILTTRLAAAGRGEAFLLQGGDCAETFAEATADRIRNKIKTILQMAIVLTYGASMPIVKMGRMAGQYAKPRSSDDETRDGVTLPAYRGDAVNAYAFTPEARTPDPHRLLDAYHRSSATLNLVRAFTTGGFADLRRVHEWNRGFTANPAYSRYEEVAAGEIDHAIRVTMSRTRRGYILPATHFASNSTDPDLPPMGMRLRLRADADLRGITGQALVIARAMQRYGLIVADNGSNWFFQGAPHPGWDDDDLAQLKSIPGTAFEVVDSGPVHE